MICIILNKLHQNVGNSCWTDPLSGMNASINPHGRLVSTASLAHLGNPHVTPIMRLANRLGGDKVKGGLQVVEIAVDVLNGMIVSPIHTVSRPRRVDR